MKQSFLKDINKINCYSSSLLYILKQYNGNLSHALKNLNFEIDFYYDQHNKVFTSIKLIKNMEELGFKVSDMEFCNHKTNINFLNNLSFNSWMVVGMSCYDIPWHFFYKKKDITHYFPVHKINNNTYVAHDAMYGWTNIPLDISLIEKYAYEVKNIIVLDNKIVPKNNTSLKKNLLSLDIIAKKIKLQLKNHSLLSNTDKDNLLQYVNSVTNNKYLANNFFILKKYNNETLSSYECILLDWISFKLAIQKLNANNHNPTLAHEIYQFINTITTNEKNFYKKFCS